MSYRPEGWEGKAWEQVDRALDTTTTYSEDVENAFEAGADAMLEGLRKGGYIIGESIKNNGATGFQGLNPKGRWYCIPEDTDKKEGK